MARVPTICRNNYSPVATHKTPVSWLHEICTRNNITPKYDLLQVEGAVHEPIFQYRLTLEYNGRIYEETGTGRSKKEAKHNSARSMLRSMEVVAPHELFEMDELSSNSVTTLALANDCHLDGIRHTEGEDEGNPVGILQELCMKMKYPPPTYEVEGEEGLPHERLFAMGCRVGEQFIEIGKGKSKKLAKRAAALNMARRLKAMPLEMSTSRVHEDDDDVIIDRLRSLQKPCSSIGKKKRRKKTPKKSGSGEIEQEGITKSHPVQAFRYKEMTGPIIDTLRDSTVSITDPVAIVKKLGIEQRFEAMYIDSEDLSTEGNHQVLVQLTLNPPLVLIGEGKTFREAKRNAAKDVIAYFSQMIKKSARDIKIGDIIGNTTEVSIANGLKNGDIYVQQTTILPDDDMILI